MLSNNPFNQTYPFGRRMSWSTKSLYRHRAPLVISILLHFLQYFVFGPLGNLTFLWVLPMLEPQDDDERWRRPHLPALRRGDGHHWPATQALQMWLRGTILICDSHPALPAQQPGRSFILLFVYICDFADLCLVLAPHHWHGWERGHRGALPCVPHTLWQGQDC